MASAPTQQRLAEGEGDGDAGEHRVLDDLGEERQPAQQHVHADDAAEHAEQDDLDQRARRMNGARNGSMSRSCTGRLRRLSGRAAWRPSTSSADVPYVALR